MDFPDADAFSAQADHFIPSAELHLDELAAQASTGAGMDVSDLGPASSDGWIPEEDLDVAMVPQNPELAVELTKKKHAIRAVKQKLAPHAKLQPRFFAFRARRTPDGCVQVVGIRKTDRSRMGFVVSPDGSVKVVKYKGKRIIPRHDALSLRRKHLAKPAIIRVQRQLPGGRVVATSVKLPLPQGAFESLSPAERAALAAKVTGTAAHLPKVASPVKNAALKSYRQQAVQGAPVVKKTFTVKL
jgi:hypothetical protein